MDRFLALERDEEWKGEAVRRRNRLVKTLNDDAAKQWPRMRARLRTLAHSGNREAVLRAVRVSVAAAYSFVEDELLPEWAGKRRTDSLQTARMIAEAINNISHDRYLIDAVNAAEKDPAKAAMLFGRGGSPMGLVVDTSATLDAIEAEATKLDYQSIRAYVRKIRGVVLMRQNRHVESLKTYEAALADFMELKDQDTVTVVRADIAGQLRVLGDTTEAWRAAVRAQRTLQHVSGSKTRSVVFAETAQAATALGYPKIALRYRDAFINRLRAELVNATDLEHTRVLTTVLAAAHRARAADNVTLGRYAEAEKDVAEMSRLGAVEPADDAIRDILQAQSLEVEAKIILHADPAGAAAKLTRAIEHGAGHLYGTYRANLYIQRAEANRLAKQDSEVDLEHALEELHKEEKAILDRRQRGELERVWSAYFARFRDTYELLVEQYVTRNRVRDAFKYAERVRAYEPLALILQGESVPQAFSSKIVEDEPLALDAIQSALPPNTFIVEYLVRERETLVWVVSNGEVQQLRLNVSKSRIEGWADDLQREAHGRRAQKFTDALGGPSEALLQKPLAAIAGMRGGKSAERRIVFVADRAMHGLPFAALEDPVTREFLIESAIIATAPSATIYVHSLLRDGAMPRTQPPSALLVLDPAFDNALAIARGLKQLQFARGEDQTIGQHYAAKKVLAGGNATVAQFLASARNHAVIHISAHGLPNAVTPYLSSLLLAKTSNDDGVLTAEELLTHLELDKTRLVLLAACSSAGGAPVGPEGVAPLVRPLLAAGVPAVVGSLWEVEDKAASELLSGFHRHYRLGMDAASALRAAQLDLLRGGDHPVLAWAPFQVIGHASSPFGNPTPKPKLQRSQ
jgi:CHAT domain-containing protein